MEWSTLPIQKGLDWSVAASQGLLFNRSKEACTRQVPGKVLNKFIM